MTIEPINTVDDNGNERCWSIFIKQVNESEEASFTVQVSPEEDVARLQKEIWNVTGIEPDRQRLIYRGRLISCSSSNTNNGGRAGMVDSHKIDPETNGESTRLGNIIGLDNGHTIHLFRRKDLTEDSSSVETLDADSAAASEPPMAGNFLTALLGMNEDADSSSVAVSPVSVTSSVLTPRLRTSRRRFHHRLESDDLTIADPGSMESVRQGLLTLHTILPAVNTLSPLHVNRQWYKGQWIDCLDTVNQWLEATIIDLAEPDAILPPRTDGCMTSIPSRTRYITSESRHLDFIAANELERRAYLCLEPCDEGCPEDEGGQYLGWKRRDNRGIKLLLVHYNGWPHRWDEWIRSDSDRIRPFRTRTRHPNSSSYASPTPQSVYAESPPTHIRSYVESEDREALLLELDQVIGQVSSVLHRVSVNIPSTTDTRTDVDSSTLPWRAHDARHSATGNQEEQKEEHKNGKINLGICQDTEFSVCDDHARNARGLQVLAPLLDRLGRTLIDAAPHVASLAQVASAAEESSGQEPNLEAEGAPSTGRSLGSLLSLLSRERRNRSERSDNNVDSVNEPILTLGTGRSFTSDANEFTSIDSDLRDFSASVVNTTRGEIRGGPRHRGQPNNDDPVGVLGYLASATLNQDGSRVDGRLHRVLRDRNGAIDITIHAIFTGPGVPSGVLGLAGLAGSGERQIALVGSDNGTDATSESGAGDTFSPRRRGINRADRANSFRRHPPIFEDEDGIFSDLYSPTPEPIDLLVAGETSLSEEATTSTSDFSLVSHSMSPRRIQSFSAARGAASGSTTSSNPSRTYMTSERSSHRRLFSRFFRRSN